MSERIRAGDILNESFQFGLRRWASVLRFIWLPMILAGLLMYAVAFAVMDVNAYQAAIAAAGEKYVSAIPFLRVALPMAVAIWCAAIVGALLIYSGAYASIFRLVALGEERTGPLQLRFDGPAQRVFTAQLIVLAANLAIWGATMILALAMTGVSMNDIAAALGDFGAMVERASGDPSYQPGQAEAQAVGKPLSALVLGGMLALPLITFINVKLSPFLAGSASENRLLLFGAYRMTTGHAWSIFGTYAMFMIAMTVLLIVFGLTMSLFSILGGLSGAGAVGLVGKLFQAIAFLADVAMQIFLIGVALSMQAIIYRRLKTGE